MGRRFLASLVAFGVASTLPIAAQPQTAGARISSSTLPRTPDGHPDLQGIWTNATITPLERPAQFSGKTTISDKEAAEFEKKSLDNSSLDRRDGGSDADRSRAYNNLFVDKGTELARVDGQKRTSLIIDPPDGKIPPMTP